ncbi:MAG: S1 RNA-binding domain-containing protein [Ruminococcaceae bacterium]|nr:S1 RNA-binding domain-containing protein [Oscillospiraceae bacterium]
MEFSVGTIVEGKVTGITKFGAFVSIAPNKSGLVHISEVANTYVNDISQHLQIGQEVKVKILSIDDNGRINLSIKKAEEPQQRPQRQNVQRTQSRSFTPEPKEPASFEEKLKQFMADSDSKMSGIKQYSDRKSASRRRK